MDRLSLAKLFDEAAYAGPEHLDPAFVAGYDRKQQFDPATDLAHLSVYGLTEESTLVELGTGTGRFALAAAHQFRHVTAVDVSPVMLSYLRQQAEDAGLLNLDTVQAGFLSYELVGPPAGVVYTRNALRHLPDFWKAIALDPIAKILRLGGILRLHDLIYNFQPSEAEGSSPTGSLARSMIRRRDTLAKILPSTSALNTARTAGSWSQCLSRQVLRSSMLISGVRSTASTPTSSDDFSTVWGPY